MSTAYIQSRVDWALAASNCDCSILGHLCHGRYITINMKAEQSLESVNSVFGWQIPSMPLARGCLGIPWLTDNYWGRLIKGSVSIGPTHLGRVHAKPADMLDSTSSFLWTVMAKDLALPPFLLSFSHSHKHYVWLLRLRGRRFRKNTELRFCKSRFTLQLFGAHWSRLESHINFSHLFYKPLSLLF